MEEKNKGVEIDLLELARKLWDNKKFIIKVTLIGAVVGLIIAFSIPKEYTVAVTFTTNSNQPISGNMGALASIAGVNLSGGEGNDLLPPELYPSVLSSTPFIQGLLNINISDSLLQINTSLKDYYLTQQKSAWWNYIIKLPSALMKSKSEGAKNKDIPKQSGRAISPEERRVIEAINDSYLISTDKKTGVTTIEVKTQSPVISAFLADTLTFYLQSYIIDRRTMKAKMELENTEKLFRQTKASYDTIQQKLAYFIDSNQSLTLAKYQIRQERLESEKNIAFTVYSQMAQQLQMKRLKVHDETPVFVVIQPAIEPLFPSNPSKKVILFGFIFLALTSSSIWILRKELWHFMYN